MRKIAVILYGPPGSGKGTQANLIAAKLGLVHFDTGRVLESVVHDPARQREKLVRRERRLFDSGKLMTPRWVLNVVSAEVKKIHKAGLGIVFSGSPRTMYEAQGLFPLLEKLYKKKNIFIFRLVVPPAISILRNSTRLVCAVCKAPLLTAYYPKVRPKHCPICGGPFYRRTVDKPNVIKVRLQEYRERTEPIFAFVKKQNYKLIRVSGVPAPYRIFSSIYGYLKNKRRN